MNEVEKMYRNSGVEKHKKAMLDIETGKNVLTLDSFYPEFTAEKQLELYKYLCKPFLITTRYYFDEFSITAENTFEWKTITKISATGKTYEECIAKLVNNLWQSLTKEERKQIRGILE